MIKVLIAEDDQEIRDRLASALSRRGYAVETAVSGRRAIDVGGRYRPQILITGWALEDSIHGLQAAAALRLVVPELGVVLTSEFGSEDLEFEAQWVGVADFVAKPFTIEGMERAVAAASGGGRRRRPSPIGFVEIAADGEILYANPRARELLGETRGGRRARSLRQVLTREDRAGLDRSTREWIEVRPRADRSVIWQVRSRRLADGGGLHSVWVRGEQLLALLDEGSEPYRYDFLVHRLLALPPPGDTRWPYAGRALIVDRGDLLRRLAAVEIERAGGICHLATSCRAATGVFERDPRIAIVVIDGRMSGADAADLIGRVRASSRDAVIVGQGPAELRRELAELGIERFLPRAWEVADLIRAVEIERRRGIGGRSHRVPITDADSARVRVRGDGCPGA